MPALDALQHDHRALREAASRLQALILVGAQADRLQAAHQALVCLLQAQLQNAKDVLTPYTGRLHALINRRAGEDRADPEVVLRDLNALMSAWRVVPSEALAIHVCRLLDELREAMEEREREVFPVVRYAEQALPEAATLWV